MGITNRKKRSKIYAICGGGDWVDASIDHIIVPDRINVRKEALKCKRYYFDVYCKDRKNNEYYNLVNWLIEKCGARRTTENELEEFWEY